MARTVNPADEARRFLDALDEKAEGISALLADTKADVARSSYSAYKRFADAVNDFDSFCILIEYRIKSAKELPLGAKDLFLRELRAIYALKNSLSSPPFDGNLPAETAHDVELAEKILREIIERAPALLDLSMMNETGDGEGAADGPPAAAADDAPVGN
jgi:hypothetical protein